MPPEPSQPDVIVKSVEEEQESFHQFTKVTLDGVVVVVDSNNCLMWEISGSDSYVNWDEAFTYIEKLNNDVHAGYTDWHLPQISELKL